jgi:diguanylate cyclase (GGDEF)-like protein
MNQHPSLTHEELLALKQASAAYPQETRRADAYLTNLMTWLETQQDAGRLQVSHFGAGEFVVQENDPGEQFFVIRGGQVAVIKGERDAYTILGVRQRGDVIGEMSLIENEPRHASIIAITPVSVWVLQATMFQEFLSQNPSITFELLKMLSRRIRKSDEERIRSQTRLRQQAVQLQTISQQAYLDPLTGVFNRRYLDEALQLNFERADGSVGILILDIDYFKKVNDTYGHAAGDLVLRETAQLMRKSVRARDLVCRYGGEEFVILLPDIDAKNLRRTAEKIRTRFEKLIFHFEAQEIRATISIGAALYPEHGNDPEALLQLADQALYASKHNGRNRVTLHAADAT